MRRKHRLHLSDRMRKSFRRAIVASGALSLIGFFLVFAALQPGPKKLPSAAATPSVPAVEGCANTLALWNQVSAAVSQSSVRADDLGRRCRPLMCPQADCAQLEDVRSGMGELIDSIAQIAKEPDILLRGGESKACGTVIAQLAQRSLPGLQTARQAIDLCASSANCATLRRAGAVSDDAPDLPDAVGEAAGRLDALFSSIRFYESPLPGLSLDLAQYTTGDAMTVRVEPGANRCLAAGGLIVVYPDQGVNSISGAPLAQIALSAGQKATALMEAPAEPGKYFAAVVGSGNQRKALAVLPFDAEAPRTGCSGFAGRWETDRGTLTASVRRGILRGTYRRAGAEKPGFLIGQVKGRHMHGTWSTELGSGGTHLVLDGTGQRFLGTAGDRPGREDGSGLWRGQCAQAKKSPNM